MTSLNVQAGLDRAGRLTIACADSATVLRWVAHAHVQVEHGGGGCPVARALDDAAASLLPRSCRVTAAAVADWMAEVIAQRAVDEGDHDDLSECLMRCVAWWTETAMDIADSVRILQRRKAR